MYQQSRAGRAGRTMRKALVAMCAALMLLTATAATALAATTYVVSCSEPNGDEWTHETENENRAERLARKCLRRGGDLWVSGS